MDDCLVIEIQKLTFVTNKVANKLIIKIENYVYIIIWWHPPYSEYRNRYSY